MDEVVEVSVGALHLLARSPENRQTMRQLNTIRLFVQVYTLFTSCLCILRLIQFVFTYM